jgi:hypothetical protein
MENKSCTTLTRYILHDEIAAIDYTTDLRKIFESVSRICLHQFFDQWIYKSGHPKLGREFSLKDSSLNIKITQIQQENDNSNSDCYLPHYCSIFEFILELRLVFSSADVENDYLKTIFISKK